MSEERMIRVTADQFQRIAIRFQHENSAKYGEHEMMVSVGMPEELGMRFYQLEPVAPKDWVPECHEEWCDMEHDIRKPGHGTCCTCQDCGHDYDNCVCNYFIEPCISCPYRKKRE